MTLSTRASLADGIHKYPCLFSASSLASLKEFRALSAILSWLEMKSQTVCSHFSLENLDFLPLELELYMLGEDVQIKELKSFNETDGWLWLALG